MGREGESWNRREGLKLCMICNKEAVFSRKDVEQKLKDSQGAPLEDIRVTLSLQFTQHLST